MCLYTYARICYIYKSVKLFAYVHIPCGGRDRRIFVVGNTMFLLTWGNNVQNNRPKDLNIKSNLLCTGTAT